MRLKPLFRSAALLSLTLAGSLAWAGGKSMTGVPLEWKPTSTLAESVGALNLLPLHGAKIWIRPFNDTRADKAVFGENLENDQPRTLSTNDAVAAFLAAHATALYREAGLSLASKPEEATVILSAEVLRCKVTEKDTYKGELNLMLQVEAGGQPLWRGTVLGESTRWGRSYKLENYYETLSDCLVDAIGKSLKSPTFLEALAGKGPTEQAAAAK